LQGPYVNKEFVFYSNIKDMIRIGRSRTAEIMYKDDSVSRVQCSIIFENDLWVLYDGEPDQIIKNSTNGLW
jgi:pSer/pThr/pTyr-binding forkhead associated (FHA) protein